MPRLLFLLPLLMPPLAQASCPTRADLADGIVLVQNWPHFRRANVEDTARGLKEEREVRIGGGTRHSLILYDHGLVLREEHSQTARTRILYHGDPRMFDQLADRGEVALTGTQTDHTGRQREITLRASLLEQQDYVMGNCRYDVQRLRYELTATGRAPARYHMDYAPALGLVLASRQITETGKEVPIFGYNWIGTKADVKR